MCTPKQYEKLLAWAAVHRLLGLLLLLLQAAAHASCQTQPQLDAWGASLLQPPSCCAAAGRTALASPLGGRGARHMARDQITAVVNALVAV